MRRLLVAAASLNQTPLDLQGNQERIIDVISNHTHPETSILCFPEMCITGYGCEDAFFYRSVQERAWDALEAIAEASGNYARTSMLIAVGLPVMFNNALYNVCALVGGGRILALIPKQNLCADGVHYETRWFKPWPQGVERYYDDGSFSPNIPFGDLILKYSDLKVGVEICEDAWAAARPGIAHSQRGVDIILNPSASHFALGKSWIRKRFVVEGSRAFGCVYVFANLLGNEAGRVIYEGDTLIASGGKLIAQGDRLTFNDHMVTNAIVDVDENRTRRIQMASVKMHERTEADEAMQGKPPLTTIPDDLKGNHDLPVETPFSKADEFEDFTAAVSLGLYDYMRKSRSNGFVLSLSGGVDSAACAVLVKEMVERCPRSRPSIKQNKDILTCVYQSTKNSSFVTERAARSVAEGLGFKFEVWDVEKLVEGYSNLVESAIVRKLDWKTDDMAMQNIQARVRAPGIWMLANIKNALLLTTSNRSEAAVGYATMDGDTCGGLAPIAGIGKPFLIDWLRYMREKYACLQPVLELKPTAELRPGKDQTDEADLMPYPLLERIQKAAIRDKLSPAEVFEQINSSYSGAWDDPDLLKKYIDRFFTLWHRNQWKRERYAPAFHVDDESLDPKTWCRFPILSGKL